MKWSYDIIRMSDRKESTRWLHKSERAKYLEICSADIDDEQRLVSGFYSIRYVFGADLVCDRLGSRKGGMPGFLLSAHPGITNLRIRTNLRNESLVT